jgi:acetyl esterase/lipase
VTGAAGQPPAFIVTGEHDLEHVARQVAPMARHFSAVGVPYEAWQVPGGTHFYPAASVVVGEAGRRSTLEEAMAEFVARTLGTPAV